METKDLFVIDEMIEPLKEKISHLKKKNHKIELAKCQFIISKVLYKKIYNHKEYQENGVKLRTHSNNEAMKNNPEAQKGTLWWFLGGKVGEISKTVKNLVEWDFLQVYNDFEIGKKARTYKVGKPYEECRITMKPFNTEKPAFMKRVMLLELERLSHPLAQAVLDTYEKHVRISDEGLCFLLKLYGDQCYFHRYSIASVT